MRDTLIGLLEEGIVLVVEIVVFGVLTTIGIASEQVAVATLSTGNVVGLWNLLFGALALFAGLYLVGYLRLYPRLGDILSGN